MSEPTCLSASIVADTIMRTTELGVTITDAAIDDEVTVVFCDLLVDGPDRCPQCESSGRYRDTIVRTVTDLPVAGHPLQLRVQVPRYRCENASCDREVFRHNTDRLARPGSSTTRRCARHVVRRLMVDHTSIAAIARELGLSWDTVNAIAVEAATGLLAADPTGWNRCGDRGRRTPLGAYPSGGRRRVCDRDRGPDAGVRRCRAGPTARSGDRDGRRRCSPPGSTSVVPTSAAGSRWSRWTGSAATRPPRPAPFEDAVTVMDPFHVVALTGVKLDLCRQRVQQHTRGHRGWRGDPLYGVRRVARL